MMPRQAGTRSSAFGPNVSSSRSRTVSKSIPSAARASGSILAAPPPMQGARASSTASALTPSCRNTRVAPPAGSRISTSSTCSVPTKLCPKRRASCAPAARYGSAGLVDLPCRQGIRPRRRRSLIADAASCVARLCRTSGARPAWRRRVAPQSAASSSRAPVRGVPVAPRPPPAARAARRPRAARSRDSRSPSAPPRPPARPSPSRYLDGPAPSRFIDGGEGLLGVAAGEQPDQPAVQRRDRERGQALSLHALDDLAQACARPDRARAGGHRVLGGDGRSVADRAPPDPAQHHTLLIEDEAGVPAALLETRAHVLEVVVEPAVRNVGAHVRTDPRLASLRPLERECGASPVRLAGDVVVHPLEADALEPRRGSRAHVSLVVVAVGDHWPTVVEQARRLVVELFERDVDRSRQVLVLVLGRRQHLYQLRPLLR